ncbi:hypothetical protein PV10_00907 [Exophiala mesophila]|uniref:Smr domain-containing protein n=1 Tax=Exophiala mesophila TaxID=212818 RepID=A0A0D1ZT82_EXOME|nr:uncharacterized protein PV10_00907 [Exophiala mesophila]KIV97119.1 hypothetical protein PV10_00907 [Exophiala mesophila]
MSYEMSNKGPTRVGERAFNHNQSQSAEQEYDRLRDLARQEADKRSSCFARSQQAYASGDGAAAHALSQEGKNHGAKMEQYNKQASEFIFRENNAEGRVPPDTIDLHGQFVEEAEDILEERIRYAQSHGQTHLRVIVGKGNHSPGHVQKIKPRVEQVCRELGLQYQTEPNEGRILINLTGGAVDMNHANNNNWAPNQQQGSYQQGYGQQPHQQQQQQQQQQQGGQNGDIEKMVRKFLPRILRKLLRIFCK